ncbi:type I secretion system permease/ATPase [Hoeflea sp. BAL378]|uniref:type I secretion system permease/ATPase n=1 Tax=Hoeflea sp. BAL378 TaxID=1547437 RepID=UPI0006916941|nr:type I secretion system permease/ATPase [Hoeflea sp. BAL378]
MVRHDEVLQNLRACRRGLLVAALFSFALNLLMLTVPLYMTSVYDRVLSSRSEETLIVLSIAAVGALAVASLLEVVRQMVMNRTGTRLETSLGAAVMSASLKGARVSGGDIQGLRDLAQVRNFLSSPLAGALFDIPVAPAYLAVVFLIHPSLGWLSLGAAVVIVLVSIVNERVTKAPHAEAGNHTLTALQKAQAQMRNAETVRAMGMFPNCVSSWGEDNARALIAADKAGGRNALFNGLSHFLRLFLQVAVLGFGAYLVLADSSVSAGIIFAASIISARALMPVNQVIGGWRSLVAARQAWARLKLLLAAAARERDVMPLPEPVGSITAEKLVYQVAPGEEPILKGLSFAIQPGEVVGILGPSGAGKSTLARILVGALTPTSGTVRIGGDDLGNWRADALGPHIGYVPQDVELLPATIAQNIARMEPVPDSDKVIAAARLANCHELIQRLPHGYDTVLSPQGHALSGGQRQRVALARAFYGNPKVVVLDEPNASLDNDGELALLAALKQASEAGITCLVVTQRTSVAAALHTVMLLNDGRIEAFGPRNEILQMRPATNDDRPVEVVKDEPGSRPASAQAPMTITARFG